MYIDISKVSKVYSGRPGCMCGCRGKWSYASTARDIPDYYVANVSDRSVKIIANKVAKAAYVQVEEFGNTKCYYLETGSRTLAVYCEVA